MKYTKHEFMEKFGLSFEYYKELENEISKSYKRMTRTDVLNHLIERHSLKWYLEIGIQNPSQNFDKINCEYKVSVDPDPKAKAEYKMISDDFFYSYPIACELSGYDPRFDCVFIDGLHAAEQVKKDFENALKILTPNGFIVLHDCNPEKEEHTIVPRPTKTGHWNGDVYKFAIAFHDCGFDRYTVDVDNGCMVYHHKNKRWRFTNVSQIPWHFFDRNRKELLNLISWDEFIKL